MATETKAPPASVRFAIRIPTPTYRAWHQEWEQTRELHQLPFSRWIIRAVNTWRQGEQ